MAALKKDFPIEQGATFSKQVIVSGLDLTGGSVRGKIRETVDSVSALVDFTCTITDAEAGTFTFSLTAVQTAALSVNPSGSVYRKLTKRTYDIEAVRSDGSVLRILEGTISISPEATK